MLNLIPIGEIEVKKHFFVCELHEKEEEEQNFRFNFHYYKFQQLQKLIIFNKKQNPVITE